MKNWLVARQKLDLFYNLSHIQTYLTLLFFAVVFFSCSKSIEKKVLFIGNSYTYRNNMPILFEEIADRSGSAVYVKAITRGKYTFSLHAKRKLVLNEISKKNFWDVIVLQGSSRDLLKSKEHIASKTYPAIKLLIRNIKKFNPRAKLYFYMTWPYRFGYATNKKINTRNKMYQTLLSEYSVLKKYFLKPVVPVGIVWNDWINAENTANLYTSDRSHPSYLGSYLVANCFYKTIFDKSLLKVNYHGMLNKRLAQKMRNHIENEFKRKEIQYFLKE